MELYLVIANEATNLYLDSRSLKYLYFNESNGKKSLPHYIVAVNNSEIKDGDWCYKKGSVVRAFGGHFKKGTWKKVLASNSIDITPKHIISDNDMKYIVDYFNLYKKFPNGEFKNDTAGFNVETIDGKVVIGWETLPITHVAVKQAMEEASKDVRAPRVLRNPTEFMGERAAEAFHEEMKKISLGQYDEFDMDAATTACHRWLAFFAPRVGYNAPPNILSAMKEFAKSDTVKEYWYEQFKKESNE